MHKVLEFQANFFVKEDSYGRGQKVVVVYFVDVVRELTNMNNF